MTLELNRIYNIDCLEGMRQIEDKSVDLIVADFPYFEIMTEDWKGEKHDWDKQWVSFTEYLNWIGLNSAEFKRILKGNGSLYVFADDKNCAYVQVEIDKLFHLENSITWVKPNNLTIKGWTGYRSYAPITERILFYSNEHDDLGRTGLQQVYEDPNCFKAIKEYMRGERAATIKTRGFKTQEEFNQYINTITGTASVVSRHYFPDSQWVFPTAEIYAMLQTTGFFQREYEELRREYEELRRPFSPKSNFTDVWTFNITSGLEETIHPTQKPLALITRIVETSSKEGAVVLDPVMGSGTTAEACIRTNRQFIGFEKEQSYFDAAEKRIKRAKGQGKIAAWF